MAITKERLNEIFNKMTADQELTPEYMDELTAYQAEIWEIQTIRLMILKSKKFVNVFPHWKKKTAI